jgi:hypothetical protein
LIAAFQSRSLAGSSTTCVFLASTSGSFFSTKGATSSAFFDLAFFGATLTVSVSFIGSGFFSTCSGFFSTFSCSIIGAGAGGISSLEFL